MDHEERRGRGDWSGEVSGEVILEPGEVLFPADSSVIHTVLGSGVAIALFDRLHRKGGMNHFVHFGPVHEEYGSLLFAKAATDRLIDIFTRQGLNARDLEAQIFGGASPPDAEDTLAGIGSGNIYEAERLIKQYNIPIVGRDVGGTWGRRIIFNSGTGEVVITKVNRIRQTDWFYQ